MTTGTERGREGRPDEGSGNRSEGGFEGGADGGTDDGSAGSSAGASRVGGALEAGAPVRAEAGRERLVLVTGGGTGIGLACARRLQGAGWRVICAGLDADDGVPAELDFRPLDVTDAAAVATLLASFPRLDGLVNGAGTILHDRREFTAEGFDRVIGINLNAVNAMTLAALPALREARGSVVNVASMWSVFGSPRNPAYSASKGGITALTRSHAVAFAADGVRVNAIAPGWIETRLSAGAIQNPERSAALLARIPQGRWGQPDDVARVVRFLLSDEAAYVTGVVLPVDGGFGIA